MTEPNPAPEAEAAGGPVPDTDTVTEAYADPSTAEAGTRVDWPAFPLETAAGDSDVDALLGRLGALPGLPVTAHGDVYAGLHDDLMEALNEDVTGHEATAGDTAS
ncbi:hypothetical protein [Arthrobacter sp. UYCu712]|uniref:hypothetical protein n=1 Tax=Arthrobacter sp. UYCu712 TaxID=3156340 RepID=UPI003393F862